jgi:hypothetical protein
MTLDEDRAEVERIGSERVEVGLTLPGQLLPGLTRVRDGDEPDRVR